MKKIACILSFVIIVLAGCTDVNYVVDEAFEKAEITGVELYNKQMKRADKSSVIDSPNQTITVTLKTGEDITNLKLAVTASTGAEINPSMAVGYQDFSTLKTYEVTSPNKTVKKTWTIKVQ